jgi:two-component system sensor histidine kinase/response regulator
MLKLVLGYIIGKNPVSAWSGWMDKHHVFLVEDDESLLAGVSDLLELSGYRVSKAMNGLQALDQLKEMDEPPDLIVSDIRMPKMDGHELLATMRKRPEWLSIPFIFLTAKGEKEDVYSGKLSGADDYLIKPFEYKDLLVAIQSSIKRREELIELQEERLEALKLKILTVLNHEFRTPLSYIVSYVDLMASSPTFEHSEELRQYISGIQEGSDRLERLIKNFLLLSELESGSGIRVFEERKMQIGDVGELVRDSLVDWESGAAKVGVVLQTRLDDEPLPAVTGDAEYLRTALGHLIENAIKFSPHHKEAEVVVSATSDDEFVTFSVCDEGIGIPKGEQKHLFDIFHQVNRDELEQQGTGAGLAIVRHIVALHDGQIDVESKPGQGSCFRILLPAEKKSVAVVPGED